EAKWRDRVSTRRSQPLVGRSAVIQSAVLATELTEDGTAARPSDDPARQPRTARLTLGQAQRRQARRREGWKPEGARRRRRLDAKHDSPARSRQAEGHAQ